MIGHKRLNDVARALEALLPEEVKWSVRSEGGPALDPEQEGVEITYQEEYDNLPTFDEIREKIAELNESEPARCVRDMRDKFLKESDWTEVPSLQERKPEEWHAAWQEYRQILRDLPTKMKTGEWDPIFDEQGLIILSNWPKKPKI